MITSQDLRSTDGARTQTRAPQHPSQECGGAAKTHTCAQTRTPHTPARTGGVHEERAHEQSRINTPAWMGGVKAESRTLTHATRT